MTDKNTPTNLEKFLQDFPDAETHGFYWCTENDYRVVVLAKTKTRSITAEFVADDAAGLVRSARRRGVRLGTFAAVAKLCETAPRSPLKFRRKHAS